MDSFFRICLAQTGVAEQMVPIFPQTHAMLGSGSVLTAGTVRPVSLVW